MTQAAARTDKILVVDDDARIRDLLRRYLTQEGFEVILAEDGKALNRLMLRETADLIVLDLMMPGEDGLSICRRLRAANDVTPIIMLTAKVKDVDRTVGLEVGAGGATVTAAFGGQLPVQVLKEVRSRADATTPGAHGRPRGPTHLNVTARLMTRRASPAARSVPRTAREPRRGSPPVSGTGP